MGVILPRFQGYMSVESKALDEAFEGTGISPRQRLISASIDFALDEIDCATAEFSDPGGLIAQTIRSTKTDPATGKIIFVPWIVRIGYFDQNPEDMTQLSGVPQMEFADFPETGDPITRLKILSSSVAMRSNVSPGGDPLNYFNPPKKGDGIGPLFSALRAISKAYYPGSEPDFGPDEFRQVINDIDAKIVDDFTRAAIRDNAEPVATTLEQLTPSWDYTTIHGFSAMSLCRMPQEKLAARGKATPIESDYDWLKRIAGIVTSLIADGQVDKERKLTEYFNQLLPGKVATSDIKVVVGLRGGRLIFKPNYDFIMENGFKDGIPVLDYRNGNRLLRSFMPSADSSMQSVTAWGQLLAMFKGATPAKMEHEGPTTDADLRKEDDPNDVNPHLVDKKLFFPSGLSGEEAPTMAWIDDLKRHMAMNVRGQAMTFGIPKLLAGQLVGFAGLGWGPAAEKDASATDADTPQAFANYNRLYLATRAKHMMGQSGLYEMQLDVAASSLDGSETKVIKSFLERLKKGVEFGGAAGGVLADILGSVI